MHIKIQNYDNKVIFQLYKYIIIQSISLNSNDLVSKLNK